MYQINSSIGKAPMYLPTLVHPSGFYLRNWDEEIFEQGLVSSLKLSITGDTAKYLDLHSREVVHLYPHGQVNPSTSMHILLKGQVQTVAETFCV